jgi:hypothetical protein
VNSIRISKLIGEEEAATEKNLALFVLLHDLGAERNDVCH